MGKLDEMRRLGGANAGESIGVGVGPIGGLSVVQAAAGSGRWDGIVKAKNAALIPLEKIGVEPGQPREEFDEESLSRLAESLKSRGQLQPIRVRWDEGRGVYVIVCGERRWRAAERAGMKTLECIVMEGPIEADELLALQMVENVMREDLKPIELAKAFRSLMDRHGWSTHRLAAELGVSQNHVVTTSLLLKLPESVQAQVERGELPATTAYEISKAPASEQARLAEDAAAGRLGRDEIRKAKRKSKGKPRKLTSRVYRVSIGRVSVELKKGDGLAAIGAALAEATAAYHAEVQGSNQVAA